MLWADESALPPSDRLSPYMGKWLDKLLGPVDTRVKGPDREEVLRLGTALRAEALAGKPARRPVYEAALRVCNGLLGAIDARAGMAALLSEAQGNTLSFRDPLTNRMVQNRAFLTTSLGTRWARDAGSRKATLRGAYAQLKERERRQGIEGPMGE